MTAYCTLRVPMFSILTLSFCPCHLTCTVGSNLLTRALENTVWHYQDTSLSFDRHVRLKFDQNAPDFDSANVRIDDDDLDFVRPESFGMPRRDLTNRRRILLLCSSDDDTERTESSDQGSKRRVHLLPQSENRKFVLAFAENRFRSETRKH